MMEVMPTPTPAVVATTTPAAGMASTIGQGCAVNMGFLFFRKKLISVERVDPRLPAARGTALATTTTRAPPPPSTSRGRGPRTANNDM